MSISNTQPSRLQRIQNAWHQFEDRENKKGFKERLKDSVTDVYSLGKGVAKSGLKLLESGVKMSPPAMFARQLPDMARMVTDFKGWKAEKDQQDAANRQKMEKVLANPQESLKKLWEGTKNYATDKTVEFLEAPRSKQMEAVGELAGDIAPFFIGVGEAKAATTGVEALEALKATEMTSTLVKSEKVLATVAKDASVIPGGSLVLHEGVSSIYGKTSHLIEKHVGKTLPELTERLVSGNYQKVSTFRNIQEAENMVSLALKKEQAQIERFLTKPLSSMKQENRLVLEVPLNANTGEILQKGADCLVSGNGVCLILDKVANPEGFPYLIFNGYPIP